MLPVNLLILDTHFQVSVDVRLLYLRLASIYEQTQLVIKLMDQLEHILIFWGHRLCWSELESLIIFDHRSFEVIEFCV